jgi:hypothetical protein
VSSVELDPTAVEDGAFGMVVRGPMPVYVNRLLHQLANPPTNRHGVSEP